MGRETCPILRARLRPRPDECIFRRRDEHEEVCVAGVLLCVRAVAGCQSAGPRSLGEYRADQPEASNMRLLGFNDLQNRSAYAPELHQQGGRWIAYVGHHGGKPKLNPMTGAMEHNGTSIVDVTDPRNPEVPRAHPGPGRRHRIGRRADDAAVQRVAAAQGRPQQGLHAALLRQLGARDVGRDRAREAGDGHRRRAGACATRTRAGGNAIPASPTSCPA